MTDMTVRSSDAKWGAQNKFRARRLARFVEVIDEVLRDKGRAHILDVGGTAEYWLDMEPVWRGRPLTFTLVNVLAERKLDPRFTSLVADCRDLSRFADGTFDVVHSNSVIEHVGRWADMRRMANEVRRLAPRHFVQTPNFWFPMEPHFRVPMFHWLPEPMRTAIVRRRRCGTFPRAATLHEAQLAIEDSILIDAPRLAELFPDARIEREWLMGMVKSIIAIR